MKENIIKTKVNNINNNVWLACNKLLVLLAWVLFFLGTAHAAEPISYEINGFYLGANVEDLGITLEGSEFPEIKYFEAKSKGAQLFFVRIKKEFKLYRIIKEQKITPDKINITLKKVIKKYGTPDKQQLKTVNVRPKNKRKYNTTTQNKAFWQINETQEFIVEIERKRIVYELIDHDPENASKTVKPTGKEGFNIDENWNPDY